MISKEETQGKFPDEVIVFWFENIDGPVFLHLCDKVSDIAAFGKKRDFARYKLQSVGTVEGHAFIEESHLLNKDN